MNSSLQTDELSRVLGHIRRTPSLTAESIPAGLRPNFRLLAAHIQLTLQAATESGIEPANGRVSDSQEIPSSLPSRELEEANRTIAALREQIAGLRRDLDHASVSTELGTRQIQDDATLAAQRSELDKERETLVAMAEQLQSREANATAFNEELMKQAVQLGEREKRFIELRKEILTIVTQLPDPALRDLVKSLQNRLEGLSF